MEHFDPWWPNFMPVAEPVEGRRAVAQSLAAGADVIKVVVDTGVKEDHMAILGEDTLRAIVEEAHRSRAKVAAHAIMNAAIRNAVMAGVDSIEHGYFISDDNLRLMHDKGIVLVPTDSPKPTDFYFERLQHAMKLGVRIAFGSDSRGPADSQTPGLGDRSVATLVAYQASGMSPIEILRTATVNAADLLSWRDPDNSLTVVEQRFIGVPEKLGAVEAGRYADLIAVAGDPLADITELQRVRFVMKAGRIVKNTVHPVER